MWTDIVTIFPKYMGSGFVMIWFLAALIYLFLNENQKPKRVFLVYLPVIMLVLYFNPLFAAVFCRMVGSEIYFRICWLMPIIIVIAYAAVCIQAKLAGIKRLLFTGAAIVLIAVSGKLVYSNPLYGRAENIYHVPQSVVEICDAIVVPGVPSRSA